MSDETVVRVTADADGYVSALERARKSAADFVTSQDAIRQRLTNSVSAIDAARQALKAQGDEALSAFEKSSKTAERWLTQLQRQASEAGKTREELMRLRAAELGVSDAAEKYIAQIEAANSAHRRLQDGVGMSAAAMNAAMRSVPAQMTDIVTQLAGGQSPLLILTQQGGQLKDMFGGVVPAVRAVGTYVAGLINPFTLTAAAAAALAYAFYAGNKEAKEFNNTLALTGNYVGQTASSFQGLTNQVAASANSSFGDARDVLLDLTKTGRYTASEIEGLGNVILRTSRVSGESLENVSKEYAKLAEDPAKWAAEHNQSMHFMDVATYQHIVALQEAGDRHAAVKAVIEATTAQVASSSVANLSKAGQAWRELTGWVSRFWEETKKGVSTGPTLQDRIDTLMGERSGIQGNARAAGRVAQIDQQVALLQEQQRMEQRAAEVQSANSRRQEAAIAAQQRIDKMADTVMSNAQRRQKDLEKLQKDRESILAAGGKFSDEDYAKLVSGINDKYKDPKTAKPKAYQDDAATRFIQQLKDQDAATRAALESADKLTGAEKQQAEFLQKISDMKGKSILTAEQKSLLANEDAIKQQLSLNVEHERQLKLKEEIAKLEERSAAVNAQIGNYQKSQTEQYQRQLDAVGRGGEAQRQAQAVKSIYTQYENLQLQLEKATPAAARSSEAYIKAQQDIRDGLQQSLQDYDTYYASLREKQSDWVNGAAEAMANYADASRNVMAQASNAATNAFKRMEDGIVSFAMTGKFNFGDFAQSVIADLIRIQARSALSGIFGQLGNLLGGGDSTFNGATNGVSGAFGGSGLTGIFLDGAKASGGPVMAGNTYLVGEKGPELFVPPASGNIVPNSALGDAGAAGGGDVTIIQHITVDSRSDQASIMQAMVRAKDAAVAEVKANFARGGDLKQLANGGR